MIEWKIAIMAFHIVPGINSLLLSSKFTEN
jgi:hypothetical protein